MHGGTLPLPEHAATERLVFLGTDPVDLELEVQRGARRAIEFLDQHTAFFSWGLNFGNPDCRLPWASRFPVRRQPAPGGARLLGGRRRADRTVHHDRQLAPAGAQRALRGSRLRLEQAPAVPEDPRSPAAGRGSDRAWLWRATKITIASCSPSTAGGSSPRRSSPALDAYRDYIVGSAGELSVAKEQNVHFRSGWFSERSATYLAAGRPVILEDTGFGAALPTGEGLFAFADLAGAVDAIAAVKRTRPATVAPHGRSRASI